MFEYEPRCVSVGAYYSLLHGNDPCFCESGVLASFFSMHMQKTSNSQPQQTAATVCGGAEKCHTNRSMDTGGPNTFLISLMHPGKIAVFSVVGGRAAPSMSFVSESKFVLRWSAGYNRFAFLRACESGIVVVHHSCFC